MKILFIILDGLGDRPLAGLGNKTPLEAAKTPGLDQLAAQGMCGLAEPVFTGALPTSEEGHLALFGYDPNKYRIKRGFFTAKGAGIDLEPGDVALRGNFCVVDRNQEIKDRRAGRPKNPGPWVKLLQGIRIDGVRFIVRSAGEHRLGIVMRGRDHARSQVQLSPNITATDPLYAILGTKLRPAQPLDKTPEAAFTAQVLNRFLKQASQILQSHACPANYVITRGASSIIALPRFQERYGLKAGCIAGKLLYKQIAQALGMHLIEVQGATGLCNTDLKAKFSAAKGALSEYDFVFLHIKAADSLAEDGDFEGKKHFIEEVDRNLRSVFGGEIKSRGFVWVVTSDHSTCCDVKRHCQELIPFLVCDGRTDAVSRFSEKACQRGGLGQFSQLIVMEKVLGV